MQEQGNETLIWFGDAIKAGEGGKVEGYLVRFSNPKKPDITGDYFTKDTDFGFDRETTAGVYFHHGLPVDTAKGAIAYRERIGTATLTRDEFGIYASAVLAKRNEYEALYSELVSEGKAGWSSGAAAHLVDREPVGGANYVKRWVIAEASITHIPAEPRNAAVSIKSLLTPNDRPEGVPDGTQGDGNPTKAKTMDEKDFIGEMTDDEFAELAIDLGADEEDLAEIGVELVDDEAAKHAPTSHNQMRHGWRYGSNGSSKIKGKKERNEYLSRLKGKRKRNASTRREANRLYNEATGKSMDTQQLFEQRIAALENAVKSAPAQSGANYAQVATKSAADLVQAIIAGHEGRLAEYGVKATKDLSGQSGGTGGYLVPERTLAQVFEITSPEGEVVLPRATRYAFGQSRTLSIPTVRQTSAVTNNSAYFAGVSFSYVNEGGTKPETEPVFEQIQFTAHKLAGITYASDEILGEAINLEGMLRRMYAGALQWKRDFDYMQGDGAGKPLGILNSAAKIAVTRTTANKIKYADVVAMWARFSMTNASNAAWVVSQPASAQLMWLEDTTGAPVYMPSAERSLRGGQLPALLGLPVIISEKLKPLGTEGDIILADFSMYGVADTGGIEIASSRDYKFINDMTTFRLVYRHDGKPLLKAPITLSASGANTTVSPFVTLS
jgi:HK97 family phage major capsid protein